MKSHVAKFHSFQVSLSSTSYFWDSLSSEIGSKVTLSTPFSLKGSHGFLDISFFSVLNNNLQCLTLFLNIIIVLFLKKNYLERRWQFSEAVGFDISSSRSYF